MRELKSGFTTGACAAAAAKSAAYMFFNGQKTGEVEITLPGGLRVIFKVEDAIVTGEFASCSVRKYAGDDPDVTDGIKVFARVSRSRELEVTGGEGIGIVTQPGLMVAPGNYAINPVPMQMIKTEVAGILPPGQGAKIELSVPGGEKLAEKTFNPELGIKGGISILGTTGIVKPMSEEAVKKTFSLKLSRMKALGADPAVLCPGNYGVNFVKEYLGIAPLFICMIGNYVGYMLEEAVRLSVGGVLIAGHTGKLVKIAGRIFNTHSRVADARREILASHYALFSGNPAGVKDIMTSVTTEAALEYIKAPGFYDYLANTVAAACRDYVKGKIETACVLFSGTRGMIGQSTGCRAMLEKIREVQ